MKSDNQLLGDALQCLGYTPNLDAYGISTWDIEDKALDADLAFALLRKCVQEGKSVSIHTELDTVYSGGGMVSYGKEISTRSVIEACVTELLFRSKVEPTRWIKTAFDLDRNVPSPRCCAFCKNYKPPNCAKGPGAPTLVAPIDVCGDFVDAFLERNNVV